MNHKMTSEALREKVSEFLKSHRLGSLATCMNNIPRSSPVQYFVGENLDIYIISAGGDKFKALSKNDNVCLLVNTDYIDYRQIKGVQVFGKATTSIENVDLVDEAQRYCPNPYQLEQERNHLKVIKIKPREIIYLDSLGDGDRTKQILKDDNVTLKEDQMLIYQ